MPICVSASKITSSAIEGKTSVTQGEEFDITVTIKFEGIGINELQSLTGVYFEVFTNSQVLLIEDASAENFNTTYGLMEGTHGVVALLKEDKITDQENCVNNAFCNTFKANLKVFAKDSGRTDFKIGEIEALVADLSKGENITTDDLIELTYSSNSDNLSINIAKSKTPVEVPTEKIETIDPNAIKTVTPATTKKQETTTTAPTTEKQQEPKPAKTKKKEDTKKDDEIRLDQILRKKINKKIITYVAIGVAIIILLVIANAIINKIRNRKLDKMLKDL